MSTRTSNSAQNYTGATVVCGCNLARFTVLSICIPRLGARNGHPRVGMKVVKLEMVYILDTFLKRYGFNLVDWIRDSLNIICSSRRYTGLCVRLWICPAIHIKCHT